MRSTLDPATTFATESTTPREKALLNALTCIVLETMDFPPIRRYSSDSHLPADYVAHAQSALAAYGLRIEADPHMMQGGAA